jgi:hypothetical protein
MQWWYWADSKAMCQVCFPTSKGGELLVQIADGEGMEGRPGVKVAAHYHHDVVGWLSGAVLCRAPRLLPHLGSVLGHLPPMEVRTTIGTPFFNSEAPITVRTLVLLFNFKQMW